MLARFLSVVVIVISPRHLFVLARFLSAVVIVIFVFTSWVLLNDWLSCTFMTIWGPSWSWSYGSWIYNYLCNQYPSPLTLWVWIPLRIGVLDPTLCYKVCQWLATCRCFSPGTRVTPINKTNRHHIAEILLKVVLNTIILTPTTNPLLDRLSFVINICLTYY